MSRWADAGRRLAASRGAQRTLFVVGLALLWLTLLSEPVVEAVGLDESWQAALAFFFKARARAGVDYVFTFGPLGFFYTKAFDAGLYWHKYGWELAAKLAFVLVLAGAARRMPNGGWRIALLVLAALPLVVDPHRSEEGAFGLFVWDTVYAIVILAAGVILVRHRGASGWHTEAAYNREGEPPGEPRGAFSEPNAPGSAGASPSRGPGTQERRSPLFALRVHAGTLLLPALLAILALVKFTFLGLATGVVLVAVMSRLRTRDAAVLAAVYVATLAAVWLALGQSPADVPAYLRNSCEIARGYAGAMALDGSHTELGLGLAVLGLIVAELLVLVGVGRGGCAAWCLALPVLFLQWKHGFTRQDAHAFGFFAFASVAPVLFLAWSPAGRWRRVTGQVLAAAAVVLAVVGMYRATGAPTDRDLVIEGWWTRLRVNAGFALSPGHERERLLSVAGGSSAEWELPKTRAEVGRAGVDYLSSLCALVLKNDMTWRPRPVFQSYSAYTSYLQELNARFFRSARAPEFVILNLAPIDHRYPTLEDAAALREIFRLYSPVMVEHNGLLLRHNAGPEPPEVPGAILLDRTVRFDEEVELPGDGDQLMSLEFRRSAWGAVRGAIFRPPEVWMAMRRSDGREMTFRVVPEMAAAGFIINPFIGNYADVLRAYGQPGAVRVRSVRFSIEYGAGSYEDEIRVTVRSQPGLVTYRVAGTK